MPDVTIYGIKNCDTMKKAMNWLKNNNVSFTFHDYRKDGLSKTLLEELEAALGWEALINKRGTTWRKLDDAIKDTIDRDSAIEIMLENPAIIKRPVLLHNENYVLGFKPETYQTLFL